MIARHGRAELTTVHQEADYNNAGISRVFEKSEGFR